MHHLKLISHKLCPFVQRARIVLEEKNIPHEIQFIDLANKPAWFLAISPLGKVPVLLVDGEAMFESSVIAEYLDEATPGSLHPTDSLIKAQNRAWMEYASSTLSAVASLYNAREQSAFDSACEVLKERFARLEKELRGEPFFNGADFSMVDAAFAPLFRYFGVIEDVAELDFFEDTPRVRSWREALALRPSVQRAVVADYRKRLLRYFLDRDSILSHIIRSGSPSDRVAAAMQ